MATADRVNPADSTPTLDTVIIGSGAVTDTAPSPPVRVPAPAEPLVTRPALVLLVVLTGSVLLPSPVASPKLMWALTVPLLGLVGNALWRHAGQVRWTTPTILLTGVLACGALSTLHYGTMGGLALTAATALLLVGCALLASHCDHAEVTLLVRGVVLLALVQLAVALASAMLGMPAPWGYLGTPGTTFETNQLLSVLGGRSTGTMAHPIPFGTLMAAAAALCLSSATRWPHAVRLLTAMALCYGVALSGSRSAALVLGLALLAGVMTPGVLRVGAAWRTAAALVLSAGVLAVQETELPVVTGLQGTGSLTHRLAALDAAGRLADRSVEQVLLGSGAESLDDLFAAGLLQLDGFFAVDNQLVATFAVAGLIGVLALVGAVLVGLVRGHRSTRPAALLLVLMFFSFDVLEWNFTAVLLVVLSVLGSGRPEGRHPSGTTAGERQAAT
ncbi:MAG: hypothetical protein JWR45_2584 [Blastococcus sp.]|jgi:hypothetical protein|nr:hypothetical protein [Blastococcus sp.]